MKRKLIFLSLLIATTLSAFAEDVKFSASAPTTVIMDRPFQLVYSVNSAAGRDLRVPEITTFDILAGPFTSTSSSIQIINGRQTSSEANSYTFTLQPKKTGTFTIPAASIMVNGQKYTSNGLSIKVLPADAAPKQQQDGGEQRASRGGSQSISADNLFIKTQLSKTRVFEQEAVLLTYKLYTLVDVVQCVNKKMPDFNGFMKQDLDGNQNPNKQYNYENLNGKNYIAVVLYQVLLYPQRAGTIEVGKANFEAVVRVQNRAQVRSIFDDFFDTYSNVSKLLTAPAARIDVAALPANKPASFTGTVGHISMSAHISGTQVKSNDAVTLKLTVNGSGNLKMIKTPDIKFPDGIEAYDPKVTNNFKTSASGISGSKVIEYTFIPRHSGNYDIPSVQLAYFDTQAKSYKVIATPVYKLQVAKGAGGESASPVVSNYTEKEDVKQIGKDIRYIATEDVEIKPETAPLFGSALCWLMFVIPLLLALGLFVVLRNVARENANLTLVKNKKANKVAQKRLKVAQKLLKDGNKDKYYEEVLKAVWTYLSDKLSIPVASLTKEKVESELASKNIDKELIDGFIGILNTCEFARYAPGSGQQEMGNLFDETVRAISTLEERYKKN